MTERHIGTAVTSCRSCGSVDLRSVLSLGSTPIANALVDPAAAPDADPSYPLGIAFCPTCALVQLEFELPADLIFDEEYPYYSSFSDALCAHAAAHVADLLVSRALGTSSLVVELASNDGYLLRNVVAAGVRALGIDPSPGPAAAAEAMGVPTIVGFFGTEQARAMLAEHGPADVIIANNVMAHVPDLNDFVGGIAVLLADGGLVTVENPYVRELVEQVEFDTIYHEHYCYFSCSAVQALMARHGLHLNDVEYFPDLHGGTLRWHIGRTDQRTEQCSRFLAEEVSAGMTAFEYYSRFADRVHTCQTELVALLEDLKARGRRVAAYGAAAKGATLLNSSGIGRDLVDYVVDRNVHKQGKLMPGCRLPIRPVEVLLEEQPDDLLLLAWNFAHEIVSQQREYAANGGNFYVPVPHPRQVSAAS
ncbi:MAG: class I SAM-dependent methyltransferase [Ilumatobacteraceae bacterium]